MKIKITNNLRKIMDKRGITGWQMSKDLGIANQNVYSSFMKPHNTPSLKNALIISRYLDLTIEDIWEVKEL